MKYLRYLWQLFYPEACSACGHNLVDGEHVLCLHCYVHLPRTYYHCDPRNPLFQQFWGLIPLEMASAFLFFTKRGPTQRLIHALKYRNRPDIGVYLGRLYGQYLRNSQYYDTLDGIVPVPLHPSREKKRGYNQSAMIAEGLSCTLGVPVLSDVLRRRMATSTQTHKSKSERWENVKEVFELGDTSLVEGYHLLLVDDVITTGATIESCARQLLQIKGVRVSLVSLAIPK